MTTNGLAVVDSQQLAPRASGLAPTTIREAFDLASAAAKSGMFGMKTPEQALMCLMRGMELGFGPATSLSAFHVISGKPTLTADAQVALCKSRKDVCRYFTLIESDENSATYETHRVGDPKPIRMAFSWADAVNAKLTDSSGDMWKKYRKTMLRRRAATQLARDCYPELLLGIYDPEEMESAAAPEPARAFITHATPPLPPPVTQEEVDADVSENLKLIRECTTLADLARLAAEFKKEAPAVREALKAPYAKRRAELAPKDPPPNGGGAPKPEAQTAPESDPEREAIEAEASAERNGLTESQAKAPAPDFTRDGDAWAAHLASEPNEYAVAAAYSKRSGAFKRANVRELRLDQTFAELQRRGVNAPDAFVTASLARRKAA